MDDFDRCSRFARRRDIHYRTRALTAGPQAAALLMVGGVATVTWDPATLAGGTGLSNGNLTAEVAVGTGDAWGTIAHSTGQYYFEILLVTTGSTYPGMGIANSYTVNGNLSNAWIVTTQFATTYGNQSYKSSGTGNLAANDVIGVAVDVGAGKVWFAKNNTWILSGNPSTATNPTWTTVTGSVRPFVRFNSGKVTIRPTSASWSYSPPTGYVQI